jgi:hypothetical protein
MGYTSEWKLVAVGPKENLERFLAWMKTQSTDCDENLERDNADRRITYETILGMSERHTPDSWVAQDDCTKCYDPWSQTIHDVMEMGRDAFGLDMAYARLGEDLDDHEFDHGEHLMIRYIFELGEVDGLPIKEGG